MKFFHDSIPQNFFWTKSTQCFCKLDRFSTTDRFLKDLQNAPAYKQRFTIFIGSVKI